MTPGSTATVRSGTDLHGCPSARVVGFIPTGMIDWPGKVAATLFLSGCPMRCPYCHNPELLSARPAPESWTALLSHLSLRRGWLDGVVITGGEPTAHRDLLDILDVLAARGVPVKLDTNGTSPQLLERVISAGLVEYVALDIKTLPERYGLIGPAGSGESVLASIRVLLESRIAHEFRTTVYPPLIGAFELPVLAKLIAGGNRYALQRFRPERTLDPDAARVAPLSPDEMASAAAACATYLPTITRGV